ncbi:hypothetical protein [Rhodococcus chondri]|uniref:Uncharacterized protein n=1 Tax=Rhodococcus chondri TaxID=3065941 RepID=A0ABU7JXN3_9NOCA|nr:hypothetical protein [Rhodococcus sp. CC-R104]MEE2034770.1 hypothetical protein [Rhodococcus sp. CC-R104]
MYQPEADLNIGTIGTDPSFGAEPAGVAEGRLREILEGKLPELAPCARLLTGNRRIDPVLFDRAVARAAATWREPVGPELCVYVLSWFVYLSQARRPHGRPRHSFDSHDTVLFGALSPLEQVAIVLAAYDEVPPERVAVVAGRALAEFELEAGAGPLWPR